MYICICHSLSDHCIRQAVREGATTMEQLRCRLGTCSQCGRCAAATEALLEQMARDAGKSVPVQ